MPRERHAERHRKTVPQAPGGEGDALAPAGHRVAGEQRAVGVKGRELLVAEQSETPQGDVERPGRMPLGENEGIGRLHHVMMQRHQGIERREIAAEMADAALVVHAQEAPPRPPHEVRQFCEIERGRAQRAHSSPRDFSMRSAGFAQDAASSDPSGSA